MLDNGLGPWRSMFIYNLYMQFLSKISYFLFRLKQQNEQAITLKLGDAERIVRCVNKLLRYKFICKYIPLNNL